MPSRRRWSRITSHSRREDGRPRVRRIARRRAAKQIGYRRLIRARSKYRPLPDRSSATAAHRTAGAVRRYLPFEPSRVGLTPRRRLRHSQTGAYTPRVRTRAGPCYVRRIFAVNSDCCARVARIGGSPSLFIYARLGIAEAMVSRVPPPRRRIVRGDWCDATHVCARARALPSPHV